MYEKAGAIASAAAGIGLPGSMWALDHSGWVIPTWVYVTVGTVSVALIVLALILSAHMASNWARSKGFDLRPVRVPLHAAARNAYETLEKLEQERGDFEKQAMEPVEHLELIFPLIEDQARFTALYEQQRDLAERLASLKGRLLYGIGSTLPARTSSIISRVSSSEPTIEPPMEMARNGNIGSGMLMAPPNRPTMMTFPPRRTAWLANAKDFSEPTKSTTA